MNLTTRAAPAARSPAHVRAVSPVSIKAADVMEDGTFTGYGSVFNVVDQAGDVVPPRAFIESLERKRPKLLWQHDTRKPIGVWVDAHEDERGLYVKGRLLSDVQLGREAIALLRAGAIDGLSIGFETMESEWISAEQHQTKYGCGPMGYVGESNDQVRVLKTIDLWEVSLVTFPCCASATVDFVKHAPRAAAIPLDLAAAIGRRQQATARLLAAAAA